MERLAGESLARKNKVLACVGTRIVSPDTFCTHVRSVRIVIFFFRHELSSFKRSRQNSSSTVSMRVIVRGNHPSRPKMLFELGILRWDPTWSSQMTKHQVWLSSALNRLEGPCNTANNAHALDPRVVRSWRQLITRRDLRNALRI